MSWSLNGAVILVTGMLFLGIVIAALTSVVSLTRTSIVAFGSAAGVCVGTAIVLAWVDEVQYPPLTWVLIFLPLGIVGVLVRDGYAAKHATHQAERASANARPDGSGPLAPGTAAPFAAPAAPGERVAAASDAEDRALAANPWGKPDDLARLAVNRPDLRPMIAANPATPAAVVAWLASTGDPAVERALQQRARVVSA